jgi:hypothetical protein
MSAMLAWLLRFAACLALEVGIATILAGRGRRRQVARTALFANLAFESTAVLLGLTGGTGVLAGLVLVLFGEIAALEILTPLRALPAIGIVLLANLAATILSAVLA